jgi:hypothetical protein
LEGAVTDPFPPSALRIARVHTISEIAEIRAKAGDRAAFLCAVGTIEGAAKAIEQLRGPRTAIDQLYRVADRLMAENLPTLSIPKPPRR